MKSYILMVGVFMFSVIALDCIRAMSGVLIPLFMKVLGCISVALIIYGLMEI